MVLQVVPEIDREFSPLYTSDQVRALDDIAINGHGIPGYQLMTAAATACEQAIIERYPAARRVLVMCGSGNNAGDGYLLAGLLAQRGLEVVACAVGDTVKLQGDARQAFDFCQAETVPLLQFNDNWQQQLADADLVVDALLGTGLSGEVHGVYREVIASLNASGKPVVAVDIPSGLNADTGRALGIAVRAQLTVTFIGLKRGFFTADGRDYTGTVLFDDLNVPEKVLAELPAQCQLLNEVKIALDQKQHLARQQHNVHKNDFGHLLIVGGGPGMPGAPVLAAEAALRSGAGLVTLITHPDNIAQAQTRLPEVMSAAFQEDADQQPRVAELIDRASVLVVGPGLGDSIWAQQLFKTMLTVDKPMVLDADGLNLLALLTQVPDCCQQAVHTPHPGEAARLLAAGGLEKSVLEDRFTAAGELYSLYGGVWVLKGSGTLIYGGDEMDLCPFGNPAMSVAGSGDVLSGVIGALMAQGLTGWDAARLGAWVHARAGDRIARREGRLGMLASDLIPVIRTMLNQWVSAP